jgi:hypothetical protein
MGARQGAHRVVHRINDSVQKPPKGIFPTHAFSAEKLGAKADIRLWRRLNFVFVIVWLAQRGMS